MLNRIKYFRKLCLSGSFLVGLISLSSTANAQFIGINVDYGIGYSAAPGYFTGGRRIIDGIISVYTDELGISRA